MADKTPAEILRGVLERVEAGEITGVAIATTHADLSTASAWSMQSATLAEMMGAVLILLHRLLLQSREGP